ncbi:MAG: sodium:proton antiporter [Candidatus Diapherotrites archaeon]|nr:sodium:proton antiporter [Candidatus Diapherotrites archaeon]
MHAENEKNSKIIEFAALGLMVPIITFGIYVIAHGHLTPGGGFQGGAIMATAFALLFVSLGKKAIESIKGEVLVALECIALIGFIGIAFLGMGNTFFFNFLANSGVLFGEKVPFGPNSGIFSSAGVIPLMNFFVGLEVCCGLTLIFFLIFKGAD